ncbi:DUF4407 domain-containing protein [Winogradskya consettensis]|uniref:DUF4407 domain-containing protein n=1 Tax=Winogradskya consettensis TaxID=113560 RepID=A0A919SYX8_9ACTN|nr:DUF4407 domain-containing protein [Actinoplanes consettensis]GIM79563.1 hypothetical protein Aco04nite_66130 [Actinoplanes consettensis]
MSDRSRGRALRVLTGADEDVLDTVPGERARFTAMGGVVLGTALIAMFSMTVALMCVFDGFHPSILLFVPVWGAFILSLDRWLMSSSSSPHAGVRARKLVPRLVLSIIFGVVIAEPLLLGVFQSAIEQRVRDDRIVSAGQYETDLKKCNPPPGTAEAAPSAPGRNAKTCDDKRINVQTDAPAKEKEIADVNGDIKTLKADVDQDDKEYANLEALARKECNGTDGEGLSGKTGQGPNCRRLRGEAEKFRSTQNMVANHTKLKQLNDRLVTLTGELGTSRADEGTKINDVIATKVGDYKSNQREIGLLERLGALGKLVDENTYMHSAEWALRLFFIVVDALPVIVKFLTGYTAYDRIVTDRLNRGRRIQGVVNETERRRGVIHEALARHQMLAEHAAAVDKVEVDARMRNVDVEVLREELTDARAEYLLHDSPTLPLSVPPPRSGIDGDARPRGWRR